MFPKKKAEWGISGNMEESKYLDLKTMVHVSIMLTSAWSLVHSITVSLLLLIHLGSDRYLGPRDTSRLNSRDPSSWTVEDVMQFVREADPQLGPHADLFRKHVSISMCVST